MKRFLLPFAIFAVLVGFLAIGLTLDPREVPSPLIGKLAPMFTLPQLHQPDKSLSPADLRGQVWLLNVWASWCSGCKEEHPVLMRLAKTNEVALYGMNYKDRRDAALTWLRRNGNPYRATAVDEHGRVGIDYGVYGVPETYVIDKHGVVRYKQIGPLDDETLVRTVVPLVKELESQ
jgi:cytochrome c biogenesis protein CcmG/thiol:disulfide interchange protein DsbE